MSERDRTLAAIEEEGGGVFILELIHLHPQSTADIRAKADAGDERCQRIMFTGGRLIDAIEKSRMGGKPPSCLLCGAPFSRRHMPKAFAIIHARVERPQHSIAAGIGAVCLKQHGNDYDRVKAAVMASIDRDFGKTRSLIGSPGIPPGNA